MIRHPLILAIGMLDLIAWVIYLTAAWRVMKAVPEWSHDSTPAQLRRERGLELAAYQAPWVMGLQGLALLLLVIGISNLWTVCVPGAMCGTGVLQAMGGAGAQTLFFRSLTLLVLYCGRTADLLERSQPYVAAASPVHGRFLLLAGPLMLWGSWSFMLASAALSGPAPVSCCAALYEQAAAGVFGSGFSRIPPKVWGAAGFGGAILAALWGGWLYRRPRRGSALMIAALALVLAWSAAALQTLQSMVAPYVFEILNHPCPWCFFLWEHHAPGFLLFGLPLWLVAESAAALTAQSMAVRRGWSTAHLQRLARSGRRLCAGASLFAALAAAPVVLWLVRFGAWIDAGP